MLIAHKLNMDAVHNSTSNDIQILQNTQPSCHDPTQTRTHNHTSKKKKEGKKEGKKNEYKYSITF